MLFNSRFEWDVRIVNRGGEGDRNLTGKSIKKNTDMNRDYENVITRSFTVCTCDVVDLLIRHLNKKD
jgi:hypothetical protein